METIKIVKEMLNRIEHQKDIENIRIHLYSIYTHVILTKELFNKNSDMEDFLCKLGLVCKPYLLKSRTMVLGKVLRKIQRAQEEDLTLFIQVLNNFIQSDQEVLKHDENIENVISEVVKEKKSTNYMNEILKKYSRTGK